MQDRAIAAIGEWQLETKKDLEPVDLYIENMFPDKDYQMMILIFSINDESGIRACRFQRIDIEKVSTENENYTKYAYRKGSARGGDVTLTTKISSPVDKKIKGINETTFKNILNFQTEKITDIDTFKMIHFEFKDNIEIITREIEQLFKNFTKEETMATGLTFKIIDNGLEKYIRDFDLIREIIIESGSTTSYTHAGTESRSKNKLSSVTGKETEEVYGFAAPFKYSSPDKSGFLSGFFNKKLNWRNYPIGANESLVLELGRKFIKQNLTGYFYGHNYMLVPNPIIKTSKDQLNKIIGLIQTAFAEEREARKEKRKRAEDRVQKTIAEEKNYFNLDILFYTEDSKTGAISINLMLEEILPSRFRTLFIDVPENVNKNGLFKNALYSKKEGFRDLVFSFQIIRDFFDEHFLDAVNKLFLGKPLSRDYINEHIINLIRKNYNKSKTSDNYVEFTEHTVKKAIMLLTYLQELKIISHNKNYNYMDVEVTSKKESRFDLDGFNSFVRDNANFLESDIKVGIFAVGVLVRFLFDIQSRSLNNTPFENKLRGYKLNPELLMNVFTEALDKIQKYQKNFYVYTDLREVINRYFIVHSGALTKMTNNEISFYFVAGLEIGKRFKREKSNSEEIQ